MTINSNEAGLVKSQTKEKGQHKVIDRVSVSLNDKAGVYEATFANLGVSEVLVDSDTVKKHPKLLVGGVWCISDIGYEFSEDKSVCPWVLNSLKPIQMSGFNLDEYLEKRAQFSTDEWIDLLIQSIGFVPETMGKRTKFTQLLRLIPFCERNYNLIELGPKGTGKSHIFSEFSPHGILISGGEITVPKLFVNNANGKIGLVGYWDVVAFDEFAGKSKKADKSLVDIMKNYMANKSFSRGVETLGAEASMVFVGNTQHNVPYMLKHSDLFDELPSNYHDSAFLDRIHYYIPGWEVDIIRAEMFSDGYGFVVDYLAEILRNLRSLDFSQEYSTHFSLLSDISTRDRDAIHKTFSGLMKILFPHKEATPDEIQEILNFAIEGRKRVKDQLFRMDTTYSPVKFGYTDNSGAEVLVKTLEEKEYPQFYYAGASHAEGEENDVPLKNTPVEPPIEKGNKNIEPHAGHVTYEENQKGVSFDGLFAPYIKGANLIEITDPYIRIFFQARNLMEFIETVGKFKDDADEVHIHLKTIEDDMKALKQKEFFESIQESAKTIGINFTWEFDHTNTIHARHIVTDTGWKISLDRGLDIFQQYDMNDTFSVTNRMQKYRSCKAFEVTYIKNRLNNHCCQ